MSKTMTREEFYQQVIGDMCDEVYALGREAALDEAWRLINARGGYSAPDDIAGAAHNEAIGVALAIIEKLGGMDPLQRGKE